MSDQESDSGNNLHTANNKSEGNERDNISLAIVSTTNKNRGNNESNSDIYMEISSPSSTPDSESNDDNLVEQHDLKQESDNKAVIRSEEIQIVSNLASAEDNTGDTISEIFSMTTDSTIVTPCSPQHIPTVTISNSSVDIHYVQPPPISEGINKINYSCRRCSKSEDVRYEETNVQKCCGENRKNGWLYCPFYCLVNCVVSEWKALYELTYVLGCRNQTEDTDDRDPVQNREPSDDLGFDNPRIITDAS